LSLSSQFISELHADTTKLLRQNHSRVQQLGALGVERSAAACMDETAAAGREEAALATAFASALSAAAARAAGASGTGGSRAAAAAAAAAAGLRHRGMMAPGVVALSLQQATMLQQDPTLMREVGVLGHYHPWFIMASFALLWLSLSPSLSLSRSLSLSLFLSPSPLSVSLSLSISYFSLFALPLTTLQHPTPHINMNIVL
jgi:hypothetical protein